MTASHPEQSRPLLDNDDDRSRSSHDSFEYVMQQATTDSTKRVLIKLVALAHPAHLFTLLRRYGYIFVPSPIRSYVWDDHAPPPKKFATSYLSGLRGMTAIKVFTFHYFMALTDFTHKPWRCDDRHNNIFLFPVFRYFWTGFTSQMFFAIAGYLTCLRIFQVLDKNDAATQAKLFASIVGSLFRRSFRLYLPVGIMMFLVTAYVHYGFYESYRPLIADAQRFPGPWSEPKPEMKASWSEQLYIWKDEMYGIMNVSDPGNIYFYHDQHLWSILAEMRASLHLYIAIIMIAGCKRWVRVVALCFLTWVFFIWNRWETWVYLLGAIVAQLDVILTERQRLVEPSGLPITELEKVDEKHVELKGRMMDMPVMHISAMMNAPAGRHLFSWMTVVSRYVLFLLAFHLMSYPIYADVNPSPGYETLKSFIPDWVDRQDKVYPNIGAGIMLFLLVRSNPQQSKWRRLLDSDVAQYLGTISFAMYLVHGPLMHAFGYMIPHHIWSLMGVEMQETNNVQWLIPILIGWAITLIVSWWVADIWTREVEARCVRLVKNIETLCFKVKAA